jgi:pimeloyl-ACP methyl ester carboxylesterase
MRVSVTRWVWIGLVLVFLGLVIVPRLVVVTRFPDPQLDSRGFADTLVVAMHGMSGAPSLAGLRAVIRRAYGDADVIAPSYVTHTLSNVDPYALADAVETEIDAAHRRHAYRRIILVGHSMGAVLLRKVLVWAHGFEEDRPFKRGERAWPGRIERFVSLAGINRGWSIDPAPERMDWPTYFAIYLGEKIGRLTGTGTLVRSLQRGAPFVADLRVQWIRAARQSPRRVAGRLPPVIHLVGTIDDIVSDEDSRDIAAAKDVKFVTIPNVGHGEIAEALHADSDPDSRLRRRVHEVLTLPTEQIVADRDSPLVENPAVTRIVYIMHGIRDYASWSDQIRTELKARLSEDERNRVAVIPAKYGFFPMLPFLLAWDRQKNVRWFMDQFTDNLAKFPQASVFDYVGHSNGTYILASALQRYRTLTVRNVLFVGSVVPKHYPWGGLLDSGRVARVHNVVATHDWVVAFFPRLFEQIAEWEGRRPATGFLDIGSAGFRGFDASQRADRRVENITYVAGGHGAGIDVGNATKLQAIVSYLATGNETALDALRETPAQSAVVSFFSNVSWLVWMVLAALVVGVGKLLSWLARERRIRVGTRVLRLRTALVTVYALVLLALLYSV